MKLKWYWHIHHKVLVEPKTEPIKNRIAYIKKNKPKHEVKLRLKLLKPVKGKIPVGIVKAWEAYGKAREAYDKAWEARVKAWEAYGKAKKAYDKAWEAYYKAINQSKALKKLHKKECGCDWDGKSIFKEK